MDFSEDLSSDNDSILIDLVSEELLLLSIVKYSCYFLLLSVRLMYHSVDVCSTIVATYPSY